MYDPSPTTNPSPVQALLNAAEWLALNQLDDVITERESIELLKAAASLAMACAGRVEALAQRRLANAVMAAPASSAGALGV
jgi:hypothetical protein